MSNGFISCRKKKQQKNNGVRDINEKQIMKGIRDGLIIRRKSMAWLSEEKVWLDYQKKKYGLIIRRKSMAWLSEEKVWLDYHKKKFK